MSIRDVSFLTFGDACNREVYHSKVKSKKTPLRVFLIHLSFRVLL